MSLQKIAVSKAFMLTILLWVATALPIAYFRIYEAPLEHLMYVVFTAGALLMLIVMPMSYLSLTFRYRCPKCKSLWSYAHRGERVLEKNVGSSKGEAVCFEKVVQEKSCTACGYKKLIAKTRITKGTV